ncbi:MAG: hypothetical protein IJ736_02630 [Firmicutes bacterium]|nr:hypothetical protein [Bacillota bacterium]
MIYCPNCKTMFDTSCNICPNCDYEETTFEVYEEDDNDTGFTGSVFDIFDCFGTSIYADDEQYSKTHICHNDIVEGSPDNFDEPIAPDHNCANDLDSEVSPHDCQNDFFEEDNPNKIRSSSIQYGSKNALSQTAPQRKNIQPNKRSPQRQGIQTKQQSQRQGIKPQQKPQQKQGIQPNRQPQQKQSIKPSRQQNGAIVLPKELQARLSPQMLAMIQQQQMKNQPVNIPYTDASGMIVPNTNVPLSQMSKPTVQAKPIKIDKNAKIILCIFAFVFTLASPLFGIVALSIISKLSKSKDNHCYIISILIALILYFAFFVLAALSNQ